MSHPVVHIITQGETLAFEIRFVGEDLTNATPHIDTSAGMPLANFSYEKILPDTVKVLCLATDVFAVGVHTLQVWLSWPIGDVREEIGLTSLVHVVSALNYWEPVNPAFDTIDGGAPGTHHLYVLDGGTP